MRHEPYHRGSLESDAHGEVLGRSQTRGDMAMFPALGVSVDETGQAHQQTLDQLTVHQILSARNPYGSFAAQAIQAAQHNTGNDSFGKTTTPSFVLQTSQIFGTTAEAPTLHVSASEAEHDYGATLGGGSTLPEEVVKIARQMRGLDEKQFLMLADLTQKRAWRNVYSLLEYHGTSWYLPIVRPTEGAEPANGIGLDRQSTLWIAIRGHRLELNVLGYLARAALLVATWLMLWSAMPHNLVELRGFVFDPILLVLISAIVGGIVSRVLQIPPLICVLWMGILWNNVPNVGYFTTGINPYVRKAATTFGLNVILIRAGLYIKPEELKPMAGLFFALAFLPAIAELVAHSFMASAMFDYPDYTWAFTHGAVTTSVSPAVVVPALLSLKLDGFGLTGGPGILMMPGAPAEMVLNIWNINFVSQLAIDTGDKPLWLNILLGPLQIIGGALIGAVLGAIHFLALKVFLHEARKLPHRMYTLEHMSRVSLLSTTFLVILGCATLFYTKIVHLSGGGAFAVVVMAMTTSALQRRRGDAIYFAEQFKYLCLMTADLWDLFTMPVLFSMVGSAIVLKDIFTAEFFPPMLACLVVGLACRMVVALLVTIREDYSMGERLVMAVGWCGKATVQAAVGYTVLDRANEVFGTIEAHHGREAALQNVILGKRVANAGVVMIIICAPVASLILVRLGPKFLRKETVAAVANAH
jgi:NhaP-type Na+/H+ or K+/H+ antiporter